MLKRLLSLFMIAVIIIVSLTGCVNTSKIDKFFEEAIETLNSGKESNNILIVGNSHSVDAFWLLYQTYKDQYPETDLCIGILHYGGACIDEHVDFATNKDEVMRYYKNNSGKWKIKYGVTSEYVFNDVEWDVILMQPAKEDLADSTLNKTGRHKLGEIINSYVKNPHEIMWHISWPSPNDEIFFSPDYVRQPPEGYKAKLERLYGFNPVTQFTLMVDMTKQNILDDDLYSKSICSGSAIMHAHLTQGFTQLDLWRDYTHLSDYGRLMAGYALVAQLTEKPIENIGIDVVSVGWRHKQNKDQGKLIITDEMKTGIIEAANYSIENAWKIPEKT